jgi:hypothetical protein
MPLPYGTIILTTGTQARYLAFYADLCRLLMAIHATENERLAEQEKRPLVAWERGVDLVYNLNRCVARSVGQWIWIIGDDHTFEPDVIERLWASTLPVVVPSVLKRAMPHPPVAYDAHYQPVQPESGTRYQRVHAAGSAGMLLARHLLPVLTSGRELFQLSRTSQQRQGEDLELCRHFTDHGIPIHLDTHTHIGHITDVEVWPHVPDPPQEGEARVWQSKYRVRLTSRLL